MSIQTDILRVLKDTSRTFAIPITFLPAKLRETISVAYLCMRALDEIEDHVSIENQEKVAILHKISENMQAYSFLSPISKFHNLDKILAPYKSILPEVTLRIEEWLSNAPIDIAPRLVDASVSIADLSRDN
ncbi:MAG: hypothetical protein A2X25_00875 [Chloroflexi bacterium GWB2_49_20]|nr:MAG: hypothetical protein A2X25_00875 [Chloroflexi bacterium GWB2_49_20]OGN77535.1 MAG: hypothetical protein A2X26_02225 [Chloroflexi bacterium GWC2_49_37]OGN83202.1 MAG: hypothetical protein A2X27_13495 [Chloroflexi bacterium GWD2_49_16]